MEKQKKTNGETENKSLLRVVVHSFFVVPFIIAIFSVIIFLVIRIMTAEPNTAQDYLEDVKIGGTTKRWQGAFELSKILSNPKMIPKDDRFSDEMISIFEYSMNDRDERIRQYLAIAMGATKDVKYVPTLIKALSSSDLGTLQACAFSLGNIGDSAAIPSLVALLDNRDPQVRLHGVISLGKINSNASVSALKEMINDPEPNVRWDAAIGLAKQKDFTGRTILIDLLDRKYLTLFPNLDEKEKIRVILIAINMSRFVQNQELKDKLIYLRNNDTNFKIKEAARLALQSFN